MLITGINFQIKTKHLFQNTGISFKKKAKHSFNSFNSCVPAVASVSLRRRARGRKKKLRGRSPEFFFAHY